jgi:uncharacterized protein (TIGR02453 family)
MITKDYFKFLNNLKQNNNREWFAANKSTFDALKKDMEKIIENLIPSIAAFDSEMDLLTPKDCIFRIYKDTRFSKDKLPYKTNFGAFFVGGGRNSGRAGYYLHIEPGDSFIGGGIYMPATPVLKKIRDEIYHNYENFHKIINAKDFKKYFHEISGSKLTMTPKGYDKAFEGMDYLKYKDFTMIHPVSDDFLLDKNATQKLLQIFKAMKPFNDFLNKGFEA